MNRAAFGVQRLASPWIRNLRTGEVRREDGLGNTVAQIGRGAAGGLKEKVDRQLLAAGYLLINVVGGCIFETEVAK